MERTEPVNPQRRANLLLRIWLFPNATAFNIVKAIPFGSDYRKNYHSRSLGFFWFTSTEMLILIDFFPGLPSVILVRAVLLILLVHGLPEAVFNKKINELAFDYKSYYPRALLYIFLVFLLFGTGLFIKAFNDQIGHVSSR